MTPPSVGCYGKLPLHGDFIRHRTLPREIELLDEWLQGGIVSSRSALGASWDSSFDALPPRRFLFQPPRSTRVLGGVILPSHDRTGRRFPFLIFAGLETAALGTDLTILPALLAPFFDRAQEAATSGWQGLDLRAFLARLDALPASVDPELARQSVLEFVTEGTNRSLWAGLLGSADDPRKYLVIHNLIETLRSGATPHFALRLPRISGTTEVSFWLELTRRLGGRAALPTLSLWGPSHLDPATGLTLLFDDLLAKYFLPLLWPERRSDLLYPLVVDPGPATPRLTQARERHGSLLDDASMKLSTLLLRLSGG